MKVIRPDCRSRFTASDFGFMVSVLAPEERPGQGLFKILQDEEIRDHLLDKAELLRALLEIRRCLSVSLHFYFYILVRHGLLRSGLDDREVSDYIASLLAEFSTTERMREKNPTEASAPMDYLFEMLMAMERLEGRERFAMQTHIGNYALFLSGLLHRHLNHRQDRRGGPSLSYYEELGSTHYRLASDDYWAEKYRLDAILTAMGRCFRHLRLALNEIAERRLFLGGEDAVDKLLGEMQSGEAPEGAPPDQPG